MIEDSTEIAIPAPAQRRKSKWLGYALLIMMIWASLCFVLGDVVFVFLLDKPDMAKWGKAQTEMLQIQDAISQYRLSNGDYPVDLADLTAAFPNGTPQDPFTREDYVYKRVGDGFTITSLGKDGVVGGDKPPDKDIVVNQTGLVGD